METEPTELDIGKIIEDNMRNAVDGQVALVRKKYMARNTRTDSANTEIKRGFISGLKTSCKASIDALSVL